MSFLTLDDLQSQPHQHILLRLDLNLPVFEGKFQDITRMMRSLPTIEELLKKNLKVIILSHFGRPKGQVNPKDSLKPVCPLLQQHIKSPVIFISDCIGKKGREEINSAPCPSVLVLENVRFYRGEEKNDDAFAKQLASLGHYYVNDAFSCSHRAHASISRICEYLPSFAGRSFQQEYQILETILKTPQKPVMGIIGGSKISTKIEVLKNLIQHMDFLVIGGGMAHTFLAAQGIEVGQSLFEKEYIPTALEILSLSKHHSCELILPKDAVVRGISPQTVSITSVKPMDKIGDMGIQSIQRILHLMNQCRTVLWNGPVGMFEVDPFHKGSMELAHHIAELTKSNQITSIAGGGDTLSLLAKAGVEDSFSYTSTAGGAFLEWLEGNPLPGFIALAKKDYLS